MVIYEWQDAKYLGKAQRSDSDNQLPVGLQFSDSPSCMDIQANRTYMSVREQHFRKVIARVNNLDTLFSTCRAENL